MAEKSSGMTVEQELAYAVHLAVGMMKEAYPGVAHEDMPPNAQGQPVEPPKKEE